MGFEGSEYPFSPEDNEPIEELRRAGESAREPIFYRPAFLRRLGETIRDALEAHRAGHNGHSDHGIDDLDDDTDIS